MRAKGMRKFFDKSSQEKEKTETKNKNNLISRIILMSAGIDIPFLLLVLTILIIGLVMMFSASYPYAMYHNHDSFHFIKSQLLFAVLGVVAMIFISHIEYTLLHRFSIPLIITSFILLVLVLLMPPMNGVHRWIHFGSFSFQASEITKFAIILSFSHFISLNLNRMHTFRYGILPYLIILVPTIALLALEPHISCSAIVVLLAAGMLFIGGIQLKWFGMVLGAIASALLYLVIFTDKLTYANNRISGWLDPFGASSGVDTWQTRQGLYAIGSGGILGLGLGNSRQKYLYIPEPQNDFIFSVVCEELGLIGAVVILLLFALLVWRGMIISIRAKDKFGMLLGIGLTAQVGLQVILNISVVTNTIPNTGISLPFFSYGGTSLMMLLAQMGVILSISRSSHLEKS